MNRRALTGWAALAFALTMSPGAARAEENFVARPLMSPTTLAALSAPAPSPAPAVGPCVLTAVRDSAGDHIRLGSAGVTVCQVREVSFKVAGGATLQFKAADGMVHVTGPGLQASAERATFRDGPCPEVVPEGKVRLRSEQPEQPDTRPAWALVRIVAGQASIKLPADRTDPVAAVLIGHCIPEPKRQEEPPFLFDLSRFFR